MEEEKNLPEQVPKKEVVDENIPPKEKASENLQQAGAVDQLSILNINPETSSDMEVHHHSHAAHGKKTWKAYLWEFLMLFLAVFCGFLAEYQLEHKIERDKAKKYMHDMTVNLKNDLIRSKSVLEYNVTLGKGLDTIRAEISEAVKGNIHSNHLYQLQQKYSGVSFIAFNLAAITQLKNAGNLRLVTNDSLVTEILQYYDRKLRAVEEAGKDISYQRSRLSDAYEEFFDAAYFDESLKTESEYGKPVPGPVNKKSADSLPGNVPLTLLNTDPKALQLLYNKLAGYESAVKGYNSFLRWAADHAENLVKHIEEEYHFKE